MNKHPRRALNCKKPLNSCLQSPGRPDSRERGVLRAPEPGWGRGSKSRWDPAPQARPSQNLGLRPAAGGAEAWPLAVWGRAPGSLPAGPRGLAQLCLPPAPDRPLTSSRFSTLSPSDRTRQRPHHLVGQLFMGRLGVFLRTCSAFFSREVGKRKGKSSQSKLGLHVSFAQLSVEHLLMPGPWTGGCCQGLGRSVSLHGSPTFPQETMREGCGLRPGHREEGEPGSSPPSALSFPFSSFLPAASPWLHPFSLINSSHTSLLSLAFTGGSLLPARSRC